MNISVLLIFVFIDILNWDLFSYIIFQNKLERSQHETNALENELQALKIDKDKQAVYIRELEQKNDDLERGQR